MQLRQHRADTLLERLGRESLVASTVETDGGMIANAQHEIFHIVHKESVVVWYRAVRWIREPEVLPDHHPVPIASLVECFVPDLAHPVPDHGEVHLAVIAHRR